MKNGPQKCAVLPAFVLTETCDQSDPLARHRSIPAADDRPMESYHFREVAKQVDTAEVGGQRWIKFNYNLFPIVLDSNSVPWDVAVVYVLSRCQGHVRPDMTTFQGIADDLSLFRRFLDDRKIDFAEFPKFKLHRPTYRFHGHLLNRIHDGEMAANTAKRAMGSVMGFYRWLAVTEQILTPEYPMWDSKDQYLNFKDARGFEMSKKIAVSDIGIKVPRQYDPFDGYINDGEKLRPLTVTEQKWLFEALADLQNPEMTLIHALMVTTGARIQTALPLRVRHVQLELPDGLAEFRFPVGPGTGVDTKNDKQITLHIPSWIYELLRTYSQSVRAASRRAKAKGGDSEDQYLFLTQQGAPYYQQKSETLTFDPEFSKRHRDRGQTFRAFIHDRVVPWIRERYDKNFSYRPHDLRATYGMNLTDIQLALVEQKKKTLAQVREFVKTRMGHESAATTDLYLNFRHSQEMIYAAIDGHETYFRDLIDRAWEGSKRAS